jgi:hypothetical protein
MVNYFAAATLAEWIVILFRPSLTIDCWNQLFLEAIFQRIDDLPLSKPEKSTYLRLLEYLTVNTILQPIVEAEMSIYGLEIDITKDRLYKVGEKNERNEMAHNTIAGMRLKGYSTAEITDFLAEIMKLSPEEIAQAFEGLEEVSA